MKQNTRQTEERVILVLRSPAEHDVRGALLPEFVAQNL